MVYLYGNLPFAPTPASTGTTPTPAAPTATTAPAAPSLPSQPLYTTGVSMLVVAIICLFIGLIMNIISHQMVASSAISKKVADKDTVQSTKTLLIVTVFFNIAVLLFSCVMLFLVFMNRSNQSFQHGSTLNTAVMMIGGFLMVVMFILQVVTNQKVAGIITEAPEFKTAAGLSATAVAFVGLGFVACMAYIVPMVTVKCGSTTAITDATKALTQRAVTAEATARAKDAALSAKTAEAAACAEKLTVCKNTERNRYAAAAPSTTSTYGAPNRSILRSSEYNRNRNVGFRTGSEDDDD